MIPLYISKFCLNISTKGLSSAEGCNSKYAVKKEQDKQFGYIPLPPNCKNKRRAEEGAPILPFQPIKPISLFKPSLRISSKYNK